MGEWESEWMGAQRGALREEHCIPGQEDEGYPGWVDGCPEKTAASTAVPLSKAASPPLQAQWLGPVTPEDVLPDGAKARPSLAQSSPARGGGRSRSPTGIGELWLGKAAGEIYDAGRQSVKAVYHHQLELKERKHIFNKKGASQFSCVVRTTQTILEVISSTSKAFTFNRGRRSLFLCRRRRRRREKNNN